MASSEIDTTLGKMYVWKAVLRKGDVSVEVTMEISNRYPPPSAKEFIRAMKDILEKMG